MALHHFFLEGQTLGGIDEASFVLCLSDDDLRHAQVLRLRRGEHISVIDAAQDYFECEVVRFSPSELEVRIAQRGQTHAALPQVVLAQGIAKGPKMDQIVRQATELGVCGFLPFVCERSVVRLDEARGQSRSGRWQQVAKSAAMQSGQERVPDVAAPMSVVSLCERLASAAAVAVCWEETQEGSLKGLIRCALDTFGGSLEGRQVVVVVGPEGGLAKGEVEAFLAANPLAQAVTLGPSILRTETAGVVACALALYELGALQ